MLWGDIRTVTVSLLLVCHASTPALRRASIPDDEPLDAIGQAAAAAAAVKERWQGDGCASAPERRARETAAALGLAPEIDERLRECDYGRWRGASLRALQADEPAAVQAWLTDPAAAPHGGESVLALLARVGGWLDRLPLAPEPARARRMLAITHPAIIRAAIVHALGAGPAAFWRIDVVPLAHVRLSGRVGRWNLVAMERPERS